MLDSRRDVVAGFQAGDRVVALLINNLSPVVVTDDRCAARVSADFDFARSGIDVFHLADNIGTRAAVIAQTVHMAQFMTAG